MLTHRCPWCGEKMNLRLPFFVENPIWWRGKELLHCPACKQRYRSKSNLFKRILTTVAVILLCGGSAGLQLLLYPYRVFWPFEISACIILMIMIFFRLSEPYERRLPKEEKISCKDTATILLQWGSGSKESIWYPPFQCPNGEIFPACFMDEKGVPISRALCVVLDYIKWSGSRSCKCTIQFVLDDIESETYFQKGNRLYLYYDYRKIAEGVVE